MAGGKYNKVLAPGDAAPAWEKLDGTDGKQHSLADLKDKEVVVLVFTCNTCPVAVGYEDRLIAFAKGFAGPDAKVAVVAVNSNAGKDDAPDEMVKRAKKKEFPFAYLSDPDGVAGDRGDVHPGVLRTRQSPQGGVHRGDGRQGPARRGEGQAPRSGGGRGAGPQGQRPRPRVGRLPDQVEAEKGRLTRPVLHATASSRLPIMKPAQAPFGRPGSFVSSPPPVADSLP